MFCNFIHLRVVLLALLTWKLWEWNIILIKTLDTNNNLSAKNYRHGLKFSTLAIFILFLATWFMHFFCLTTDPIYFKPLSTKVMESNALQPHLLTPGNPMLQTLTLGCKSLTLTLDPTLKRSQSLFFVWCFFCSSSSLIHESNVFQTTLIYSRQEIQCFQTFIYSRKGIQCS